MALIIISILAIIVMFKITLVLLKLMGKLLGAAISVLGYLVLGGILLAVSIPLVIIPILAISGIISIVFGCVKE